MQNTYDLIINNIHSCIFMQEKLFEKACVEEQDATSDNQGDKHHEELTISGDGTSKKRGYTSLYGVTSLIGYYTGKIIDSVVKSSYCKQCERWKKQKNTEDYNDFYDGHKNFCAANHNGSSGKNGSRFGRRNVQALNEKKTSSLQELHWRW